MCSAFFYNRNLFGNAERGVEQVNAAARNVSDRIATANQDEMLATVLQQGLDQVSYAAERERQSVASVLRLAPAANVSELVNRIERAGQEASEQIRQEVNRRAAALGRSTPVEPMVPAPDPQIVAAGELIVKRLRIGSIPLDDVPPDQREGFPSSAWDRVPQLALFWCDGDRRLAEVIRLVRLEVGQTDFDFERYFRFLAKHGYVQLINGKNVRER